VQGNEACKLSSIHDREECNLPRRFFHSLQAHARHCQYATRLTFSILVNISQKAFPLSHSFSLLAPSWILHTQHKTEDRGSANPHLEDSRDITYNQSISSKDLELRSAHSLLDHHWKRSILIFQFMYLVSKSAPETKTSRPLTLKDGYLCSSTLSQHAEDGPARRHHTQPLEHHIVLTPDWGQLISPLENRKVMAELELPCVELQLVNTRSFYTSRSCDQECSLSNNRHSPA
jgi:hypothetical protein